MSVMDGGDNNTIRERFLRLGELPIGHGRCRSEQFSHQDFSNLQKMDAAPGDYTGVTLIKCTLNQSRIEWASFFDSNLTDTKFVKANLRCTNFGLANISGIDFSGAILNGTNFAGSYWQPYHSPKMTHASTLIHDECIKSSIQNPSSIPVIYESIEHPNQSGNSFYTTNQDSFYTHVNISGRFDGLSFNQIEELLRNIKPDERKAIINQVRKYEEIRLSSPLNRDPARCLLRGTDVHADTLHHYLPRIQNIARTDLNDLDLHGTDLSDKNMAGCRFDNSNLSATNCYKTNFEKADFGRADLSGAFLQLADLRGADLSRVNLANSHWLILEDHGGYFTENMTPPVIGSSTRFIPTAWDNPFHDEGDTGLLKQHRRFQGWDPHQFKQVCAKIGPLQRNALKKIANFDPANVIQLADAADYASEIKDDYRIDLTHLHANIDKVHLPVLKGHHQHVDLRGLPLRGGFIEHADLRHANLAGQNLIVAVISNSDLRNTALHGANLENAMLVNVDLSGADLRHSNLAGATFVNCNLDGVQLDGVLIDGTRMLQSTLSNTTIGHGTINDLITCQSIINNVNFHGHPDGPGLIIGGIGMVDSVMMNSHFAGNTSVGQIELSGSLMSASGPGILDQAEMIISPTSAWRDQRIHLQDDFWLGKIRFEQMIEVETINQPTMFDRLSHRVTGQPFSPLTGLKIYDFISDDQGPMGNVHDFEHLARNKIGHQPALTINRNWTPLADRKIILPFANR